MKKITRDLLSHMDEEELLEYLNSLEDSIEEDTEMEKKLDKVIDTVLAKYDYFNDPRHLRASNIMAINQLLKTKKELHDSKISGKKDLLNIIMKKRSDDSKNKTMLALGDKETSQPLDFKNLLIKLDTLNIHPIIDKEMLEKAEGLIDTGDQLAIGSGSSVGK